MLTSATRIRRHAKNTRATSIQPRKTPGQRRSAETVTAILEAAAHILECDGLSRFNTNAVAQRAGVSIGSLYQFFPGKDAILAALIAQFESSMLMQFQDAFARIRGLPLERALRLLVRTMIKTHCDRPALYRILEAAEDRLIGHAETAPLDRRLRGLLSALLREHRTALRLRCLDEAAEDVLLLGRALVNGALARGDERWKRLEQRLYRAVAGYLFAEHLQGLRDRRQARRQADFEEADCK